MDKVSSTPCSMPEELLGAVEKYIHTLLKSFRCLQQNRQRGLWVTKKKSTHRYRWIGWRSSSLLPGRLRQSSDTGRTSEMRCWQSGRSLTDPLRGGDRGGRPWWCHSVIIIKGMLAWAWNIWAFKGNCRGVKRKLQVICIMGSVGSSFSRFFCTLTVFAALILTQIFVTL